MDRGADIPSGAAALAGRREVRARRWYFFVPLLIGAALSLSAGSSQAQSPSKAPTIAAASGQQSDADLRIEGERRFRTNCGRCHLSPHKFPPRMMATIVRHMRVRATITDEDMRLILRYMTQ